MKSSPLYCLALAAALGCAGRAAAQGTALTKESPFLPAGAPETVTAAGETYEFAGVLGEGRKTLVNIYDRQVKKGRWLAVGEESDGIKVFAYDPKREQVIVKIGGEQKVLPLRKSTGPSNAPVLALGAPAPAMNFNVPPPPPAVGPVAATTGASAPPPAPADAATATTPPATDAAAKPAAPAQPLSVARQEEEARMLVSDLLEIGMAQRKAYEEKQKQAAAAQNGQAAPPPAPPNSGG